MKTFILVVISVLYVQGLGYAIYQALVASVHWWWLAGAMLLPIIAVLGFFTWTGIAILSSFRVN